MTDLLDTLMDEQPSSSPAHLPLRVLADWFITDCQAKNLQPATIKFYRLKLGYLIEAAGDRLASSITTQHLRTLIAHYSESRNWTVTTSNHAITTWKVFFHYLEQEELIEVNPTRRLQKLKGEQRLPEPLTASEILTLLENAGKGFVRVRNTAMLLVLLDCGLRLSELANLKMSDVDLDTGQLLIFGKGRKERLVPFSGTVRRALLKYISQRHTHDKAFWVDAEGIPFSACGFKSFLVRIEQRTGIRVHAHKFRHTYASQYIANGGSPSYLQRLLGHTSPVMTNRYVHLMDTDAREDHRSARQVTNLLGPRWRGKKSTS